VTRARSTAAALLVAGPFVLAFRSGGYFDEPRIVAAIVAWLIVAFAALGARHPLPRRRPGRMALGGLAALTAWVAISWTWAPLDGPAQDDLQRLVLYLGVLIAAIALFSDRAWLRRLEVCLAGGAVLVIGYSLLDRLAPWLVTFSHSLSAGGRLEQPLTYWNAMGLMAALGLVLCARIAGDPSRHGRLRGAAVAASAVLGTGVYLSFSRGAVVALAAGLVVLLATTRSREQARAVALVVVIALIPALAAAGLDGFKAYAASRHTRDLQGLVMIGVLAATKVWAMAVSAWIRAAEAGGRLRTGAMDLRPPGGAPAVTIAVVVVLAGAVALVASSDRAPEPTAFGANTARFGSLESHRYQYWKVALRAFAHHPLKGVGTGGFRVEWKRERTVADPAVDAHSLYIETAAELGLVGLIALALMLAGVADAARRAFREDPAGAAGAIAALAAWSVHAGIDWDWEMPAVSLPALILAGALVARAEAAGAD
jgi:hypothetical protein